MLLENPPISSIRILEQDLRTEAEKKNSWCWGWCYFLHWNSIIFFILGGLSLRSPDFVYTVWYQTKKVVSALNIFFFFKHSPSFLYGEQRGGKAKKQSEGVTKWAGRELTARQDWQERREAGEVQWEEHSGSLDWISGLYGEIVNTLKQTNLWLLIGSSRNGSQMYF